MIEDAINKDLKQALLSGDKVLVVTLRGLKSALLYAKIANNSRDRAMSDDEVTLVLQKEAKKRQESADLYRQGGNIEKATAEEEEKAVISKYLPAQLTEAEVAKLVDDTIARLGISDASAMGQAIGAVKQAAGASADGALIAKIVKQRLQGGA